MQKKSKIETEKEQIIKSIKLFIKFKPYYLWLKYFGGRNKLKRIYSLIDRCNSYFMEEQRSLNTLNNYKYDVRIYRDKYDSSPISQFFGDKDLNKLFYDKKILDFGCGLGGKEMVLMQYKSKSIVGIDLSRRNIRYAREREMPANIRFLKRNILKDRISGKYDIIFSFTVFEHIPKKEMVRILVKLKQMLTKKGKIIIVYNFYNDRFGSHLKEYIFHPWPQQIFNISDLFKYWNNKKEQDKKITHDSYFPKIYNHGNTKHNHDCYMNINMLNERQFEKFVHQAGLRVTYKYHYTKFELLKKYPYLPKKYLAGSCTYILKKGL